jgi:hypothetical protein
MKPTGAPSSDVRNLGPDLSQLWTLCDGTRTVAELAGATGWSREVVWQRLDRLADAGLLTARVTPPTGVGRDSRRQMLRRLTATAALAPAAALAEPITINSPAATAALTEENKKEGRAKIDAANAQARTAEEGRKAVDANLEEAGKNHAAEELAKLQARENTDEDSAKKKGLDLIAQEAQAEQSQKAAEETRKIAAELTTESARKSNLITDDDVQNERRSKSNDRLQTESDTKFEESGKFQESRAKGQDGAQEDVNKADISSKETTAKLDLGSKERTSKKFDLNQEQSAKVVYPASLLDIPEPQTWSLVGLALVGVAALRARSGRPTTTDEGTPE